MTIPFMMGPVGAVRVEARERFARLLADSLEHPIVVEPTRTYAHLFETICDGEARFAWLPPALYVRADQAKQVTLLMAGVRARRAHFRGTLFVRDDTRFETIEDLRNSRVGWVDENSCSGYLFPRLMLIERGIDPNAFFSEERFLGDHLSVTRAVESGEIDVGATFVHLNGEEADAPVASTGWGIEMPQDRMRSLLVSDPIPADVLVASQTVAVPVVDRFAEVIQSMHDEIEGRKVLGALFGVERFEPVLPSRYAAVAKALANV